MRTVVVLPTYNEAGNVRQILHALTRTATAPDVLVVDDDSPDGTADLVRDYSALFPQVRLHVRAGKAGLAAAYVDGFTRALGAGYDAVVQMDADGSHEPADVDRLVAALDRADLAIGSRYVRGGGVDGWPLRRQLLSRGGNTYARLCLGLAQRDVTGGFKAWRARTLERVLAGPVRSDGYAFQVEMTVRALQAGARVVELPITFRNRAAGESKMTPRIALEAVRVIPALRGSPVRRAGQDGANPRRGDTGGSDVRQLLFSCGPHSSKEMTEEVP